MSHLSIPQSEMRVPTDTDEDQLVRKKASEQFCHAHQIPVNPYLPVISSERETTLRSKEAVIERTVALYYLGLKSEGLSEEKLDELEAYYDIRPGFSPEELEFVDAESPSRQQVIHANWRYESLHIMLWALGYVDSLSFPSQLCNVADDTGLIIQRSRAEFEAGAKLRSKHEILDQADLIYRIHWACVQARLDQVAPPAGLDPSVVYERHYALNWLIRYGDQDWDEVSTDT